MAAEGETGGIARGRLLHRAAWRASIAAMPPNLIASILVLLSFLTFTVMSVLVRAIGNRIPVVEMVFVRQVMAFVLLAPVFYRYRGAVLRPQRLGLHALRGVTATGAMVCGLSAVLLIPLADATAIQMAEVLIVTALAALILREKVGWRRWTATGVGFAGVLIMIKPFGHGLEPTALVALLGAALGATNMIILRLGARYDRAESVLFWQGLVVLVLITPVAMSAWVQPDAREAAILFLMSLLFTSGMWIFTQALRMGETSALAPLHYVRLLMMACVGWFYYHEVPSVPTVVGGLLVVGAASYTMRRNAVRGHAVPIPAPEGAPPPRVD